MSKKQIALFDTWNKIPSPQRTDRNSHGADRNAFSSVHEFPSISSPNSFQSPKYSKKPDELANPEFDYEAGKTWIYPTNYPIRAYQFSIVQEALFKNTLVVLPTGLGKTFIAAVVMYNIYRWFPNGKVVFMAPTKPLVAQQVDTCFNITGIPQEDTTQMTGTNEPELRKSIWLRKRMFFLTPQVLVNDLVRNICPATSIKCIVVDEAHKALGNHAYCRVIKELCMYSSHFRVLALTATPGSETQAVKQVLSNLLISHVEMRSEDSEDVKQYFHLRDIEKIVVPLGDRLTNLKSKFLDVINMYLKRLTLKKIITAKNPASLCTVQVLKLRDAFSQNPPDNINKATYGLAMADISKLITLYHAYELLLLHGAVSFYNFFAVILNPHARSELLKNYEFEGIMEEVYKTYIPDTLDKNIVQNGQSTARKKKVLPGHPKLDKLLEVVLQHFERAETDNINDTRVMIFTQYRDSVQEIVDMLNNYKPTIKVMSFIGQSSKSATSAGYSQKQQLKVIQKFRTGGYNTLVSTCVGEKGLDIGEVDLIVYYDCPKSPIRLVQRMGRTGRLRKGRIIILIAEGKEEQMYNTSEYSKKNVLRAITKGFSFAQFYQNSPSLIPPGVKPVCVKTVVTVPRKKQEPKVRDFGDYLSMADEVVIDSELLIHLVHERPVLWDKTLDLFKDRNATRNAWREVCLQFRNDFDELQDNKKNAFSTQVMKRWKHLHDAFVKSEKKDSKTSGSQATKKRKYIFNDELQFLRKMYQERGTSYISEDEENGVEEESVPSVPPEVSTVVGTSKTDKKVSKTEAPTRKHKKMDEVDLKILQADMDRKDHEKKNCKLSFFESLLPHVNKFNDDEWFQCQMEFLQVISKIKNKSPSAHQHQDLYTQSTSQFQQFSQPSHFNYPQPKHFPQMPQQAYSSNMPLHHLQPPPIPAQTYTGSVVGQFQPILDVPQQKSSSALHYENYSQLALGEEVDSRSSSVHSAASSNTIDFAEL